MALPPEFTRIARFFAPLAGPEGLGLLDDAALLTPQPGHDLVLSADMLTAGVHFFAADPPDLIARKALRTNLSDLAAKGAKPLGYLLTIAVPRGTGDAWFAAFAEGLAEDQQEYRIALWGGDTTATPGPLTVSITIIGEVATGGMVRRQGALPGDEIWITGTIGDGALGIAVVEERLEDATGFLRSRYLLPQPRLGLVTRGIVNAAMDVSDGLVQDLGHLCRASGLAATLEGECVPLSPAAAACSPAWRETILTGGDDYEVLMAVNPANGGALRLRGEMLGIAVTKIGRFHDGMPEVEATWDGKHLSLADGGYSHR